MNKQREALQMALEALNSDNPDIMLRAGIAIREALAEPEPKELTELEKRITDLEELRRVAALNHDAIVDAIHRMYQNRKPEPELEFWPGDVLICKEDGTKVTVANGNRGSLRLRNGKIAVAWDDNVFGEYTIEQIKEMFYQDEKPEPEQEPVAIVSSMTGDPMLTMDSAGNIGIGTRGRTTKT